MNMIESSNFSLSDNSGWSIEGLFRHILWNIRAFVLQFDGKFHHEMMVRTDGRVTKNYSKQSIRDLLTVGDEKVEQYFEHLDNSWLEEKVTTYYGKEVTKEHQLFSILCHELEHHGQIRAIYAKLQDKTVDELYGTDHLDD